MDETYRSEFTKSKVYKIQINILYNTKDTDDTNSDDLNTNYFIINNMHDILIEEFKNTDNYKYFKTIYPNSKSTPLYIVKDSFYIDRNVMESLRKVTSAGFPKERGTEPVKAGSFITYFEKFVKSNKSNTKITAYKADLFAVFRNSALKAVPTKYKGQEPQSEVITSINKVPTFDELFKNNFFLELIGTETFNNLIQQIYEKTPDDANLKQALNLFYNIFTKLNNKAKYEYFLDPNIVKYISKIIDDNTISSSSSNDDYYYMQNQRKPTLNDNRVKEETYNKYYKYLFPNKKDTSSLSDLDKDKILMFNNVYYIIKNIYLLDDTIISITNYKANKAQPIKKYYIKQVGLCELNDKNNITHFQIKDNEVIIFIKATLEYIIENPILQINYLIDDLENARQNFLPQSYILEPKDISNNYSNYNKIYIHDKINYKNISSDIDYFAKVLRNKNTIKNKEEFFLNTQAVKLFNNYFQEKFKSSKQNAEEHKIIESNIKFLLYVIFKFYNNKVFKKYYIADTYIKYFKQTKETKETKEDKVGKEDEVGKEDKGNEGDNEDKMDKGNEGNEGNEEDKMDATDMEYYSIINKSHKIEDHKKYEIISTIFNQSPQQEQEQVTLKSESSIYQKFKSADARLPNNIIYKIDVVFRCFLEKNGKKPTLARKLIAENCLSKAQKLDEAFTNTLYKAFRLPKNYLYNKLTNITHKQKPNVTLEENVANKGGGKISKIYKYSKNSTRKYKNNANLIITNNNL